MPQRSQTGMCGRGARSFPLSEASGKRAPASPDACRDSMPSIANRDWCRAIRGGLIRVLRARISQRAGSRGGRPAASVDTQEETCEMKQIDVGIIGTGWCGGIRAQTCAANPLVKGLHLAEIRPERLAEVAKATAARTAVTEYRHLLSIAEIEAIYISATPETTHYPMARDCLAAGKTVFLAKPVALELSEADEIIALARER